MDSLTLNQVRDALAAWWQALPFGWRTRKRILETAAWRISYLRYRNTEARVCHAKKTRQRLRDLGIEIERIRTCVGSNFAL